MTGETTPDSGRISSALSLERLAPYLAESKNDSAAAVELYAWNMTISGAFYEALGLVEVVMRNAMSARLSDLHGSRSDHWYDDPQARLSVAARDDIAAARRRLHRLGRGESPGRVIAELNFGFWRYLLARRYEATLWTPALRHAFPNLAPRSRTTVYRSVSELHLLRNRIAHHEPIHRRNLMLDALNMYRLLDWIDTDVRVWAVGLSRIQPLIASRPGQ